MDRGAKGSTPIGRSEERIRQDGQSAIQDATLARQGGTPAKTGKNSPATSNPQSTIDVQNLDGSYESPHSTVKELQDEIQPYEVRNIGDSVGEGGVLHLRQPVPKDQKGAADPDETQEYHVKKPPKSFESGGKPNEDDHEGWTKLKSKDRKPLLDSDKLSTKNKDLLSENQKLLLDSDKLSTKNKDLLSENQKLLLDSDKLSTKNKDLLSENHRLSTELRQASVQYQALHNEHATHRCAGSDDLEVSDRDIEDKFKELQMIIGGLFSGCNVGGLEAVVVQDMGRKCGIVTGLDWWEFMEVEARESWLAGLLANVLHSEFFKTPFFLLGETQRESCLVDFERLIFDESNGISEQHATRWRARTFRIAEVLNRRTQLLKCEGPTKRLFGIFRPILTNKETYEALSEICGLALNCAALLRESKSRYFWEQKVQPVNATSETAKIRRISKIDESKGPKFNIIFNVFGGVVKESRKAGAMGNPAEKRSLILKAVVAISEGYRPGAK
ncbi:MAG: hypothetical protein M1840_007796 [Geoglossum simile]|nr:MAG: hypothetical protein M1840_007796 [Geoglossum simile]